MSRERHTLCTLSCALLHQSETHPPSFHELPHSCAKYRGCTPERHSVFGAANVESSNSFRTLRHPALFRDESALTAKLCVLAAISRSLPSLIPSHPTLPHTHSA